MKNVSAQIKQRVKDHGLGEQVRIKWIKQPDGKIFHFKKTEEEKEKENETEEENCMHE